MTISFGQQLHVVEKHPQGTPPRGADDVIITWSRDFCKSQYLQLWIGYGFTEFVRQVQFLERGLHILPPVLVMLLLRGHVTLKYFHI